MAVDGRRQRQNLHTAVRAHPRGCRPYHAALDAGDTEEIVSTFAPDGYLREPVGPPTSTGASELRSFFTRSFSAGGGIGLQPCVVTDDACARRGIAPAGAATTRRPRPASESTSAAGMGGW